MKYLDYDITRWPKPIPTRAHDYEFVHDGYDGPGDPRAGTAGCVAECRSLIHETESDLWADRTERAVERADAILDQLAEEFRLERIKPFCDHHKLRFLSGNGTFFFVTRKGRILYPFDLPLGWFRNALGSLHEDLATDVPGGPLGWRVGDYDPEVEKS